MKIGFVIGNMSSAGGTERVLQLIANGLNQRGYRVIIISMWGNREPVFPMDKQIKRYRLGKEYPKGIGANLRNISALYRIVKKEQITLLVDVDLILTFYSLPVKLCSRGLKTIAWEHFNYYYQFRKNNRIRRIAMKMAARFSDAVLVLSQEDETYYRNHLNIQGYLYQIYNPNTYEGITNHKQEEKMIFAAGRLTKAKGFDYLLQSWELLEKDFPDWQLCIAGEGEEEEALLKSKKEKGLKSVHFVGSVSDMETYYERAAFFVLPSRNEGFGMVLIEAMAYGKPVVSFACKAGPRDIITDGEDGFLVPTGDYRQFASKMRLLMESEEVRRTMGAKAKESTHRFDIAGILDRWEGLLATVSGRKRI